MSSFADYGVVTTRELDEGAFTLHLLLLVVDAL